MKHIYFVPGLAASSGIFEKIRLPESDYTCHYLEWHVPKKNDSLESYALKLISQIKHHNPILIGVSFGGIVVQEMALHMTYEKLVIISSAKSVFEFPRRIRYAKRFQIQRFLPTFLIENIEWLYKYNMGIGKKKLDRYSRYLFVRDRRYLDWAFDAIVNWNRYNPIKDIIHIHGLLDTIFPVKYLSNYIAIPDGDHAAILTKAAWFNKNLPMILNK